MNRAQPPRGSPLGIPPWLVPRSFLCKQKCSSTLAWAKHRLRQTQGMLRAGQGGRGQRTKEVVLGQGVEDSGGTNKGAHGG